MCRHRSKVTSATQQVGFVSSMSQMGQMRSGVIARIIGMYASQAKAAGEWQCVLEYAHLSTKPEASDS